MSSKNTASPKHGFGRNLYTLLIVLPIAVIVILGVFITINYVTVYNSNKISPFIDKTSDEKFTEGTYQTDGIQTIKEKEFLDFGILLKCTTYNEDSKTATYELRVYENESTPKLTDNLTANICLAANWIGFASYGSKSSTIKLAPSKDTAESSTTYRKTFTVNSLVDLPAKADTWPVKITVSEPTIYLYLAYSYQENGKTKTDSVIIKYSYDELKPESGGIRK